MGAQGKPGDGDGAGLVKAFIKWPLMTSWLFALLPVCSVLFMFMSV